MKMKFAIAAVALAMGLGSVQADELFRVKYSNIREADVPNWGGVMNAFDGYTGAGQDSAISATVDLKDAMHITHLYFHGRPEDEEVGGRMRNARFLVSNDASNWTLLHTVPSDFMSPPDAFVEIPWPDAATASASWRYVRWEGVTAGSMTEFQIYTDSDSFQFDTATVASIATTTFDATAIIEKYGAYVSKDATLYCAVAENDLGTDFADWQTTGDITDCGLIASDTPTTAIVPSHGPGIRVYARFFAVCDGVVRYSNVMSFIPVDLSVMRQYALSDANLYPSAAAYSGSPIYRAYNGIFDDDDTASSCAFDLLGDFHIAKICFHSRNPGLESRVRGMTISVSTDGENWTPVYVVPNSYTHKPDMVAIDWSTPSSEKYRYVRWDNVQYGSMDEFQIFVDSDGAVIEMPMIADYSATNVQVSVTAQLYGTFGNNGAMMKYAIAESDLGESFADWEAGGVTGNFGAATTGVPLSGSIPTLGAGVPMYIRFFAISGDNSFASPAKAVVPADYALFKVTAANILYSSSGEEQSMHAFDGITDQTNENGADSAVNLTLDLKAQYPIARLRFFDRSNLADRMRRVRFSVSKDGVNWTLLYTVPDTFAGCQPDGAWIPWPSGDAVLTGTDNTLRYISWEGVTYGSISEFEVYACPINAVIMGDYAIESASSTELALSGSATLEGSFSSSNITYRAALAASDLGEDLAAWIESGTVLEIGSADAGEAFSGTVSLAGLEDRVYLRVFAEAGGKSSASAAKTFVVRDCTEVRPLVQAASSILAYYPSATNAINNIDLRPEGWKAFDADLATASASAYAAADFGRAVRIDRLNLRIDPANVGNIGGMAVQISNDGWNWDTIASISSAPSSMQAIFDLDEPRAARYVRFLNVTSGSFAPAYLQELQVFTADAAQPHAVIDGETEIARSTGGIRLSARIAANGGFTDSVHVYGLCAPLDLGIDPAAWTPDSGVVTTDFGTVEADASFTGTIQPAVNPGLNAARLMIVCGEEAILGAPHFFTPCNEVLIPISLAQVQKMSGQVNGSYAEDPSLCEPMAWSHIFFGRGTVVTTTDANTPAAAALGPRHKLTRVELYARIDGNSDIVNRANGATVYYAPNASSDDWTQTSEWTQFATCTSSASALCNGWQQLVGEAAMCYHVKAEGGRYGNYFLRFWGVPCDQGTVLMLK